MKIKGEKRKWDDRLATTNEIRGNTAQEWRYGWTREIGSRGAEATEQQPYMHDTGARMMVKSDLFDQRLYPLDKDPRDYHSGRCFPIHLASQRFNTFL